MQRRLKGCELWNKAWGQRKHFNSESRRWIVWYVEGCSEGLHSHAVHVCKADVCMLHDKHGGVVVKAGHVQKK